MRLAADNGEAVASVTGLPVAEIDGIVFAGTDENVFSGTYFATFRSFPAPFCNVSTIVSSPNSDRFSDKAASVLVLLTNTITRSTFSLQQPERQAEIFSLNTFSVPSVSTTVMPPRAIDSVCGA